jgi:hypothetical protein
VWSKKVGAVSRDFGDLTPPTIPHGQPGLIKIDTAPNATTGMKAMQECRVRKTGEKT